MMSENQPMSLEAFRAKRAARPGQKKPPINTTSAKPRTTTSKSTTTAAASKKVGEGSSSSAKATSLSERHDRARQMREQKQAERLKQLEESKAREAERKAAADERKKRQELMEKQRKEEILKRSRDRQTAATVKKTTSGIPVPKKSGGSRQKSSGGSSLSPATRVKSATVVAASGSSSPLLSSSAKTASSSQSSARNTSNPDEIDLEKEKGDRSPQLSWYKLKSSEGNVRSPPKLEIDKSILGAAAADDEVSVEAVVEEEGLAARRRHDREEASRLFWEAERRRGSEAKEEEEQRIFDELEKLAAEEEEISDTVYLHVEKDIEIEINNTEEPDEMESRENDIEETAVKEEESEGMKQLSLQEDESKNQVQLEIDNKEEERRIQEEKERAERKKRLEAIMQRTRSRVAASSPATVRSTREATANDSSISFSQHQPSSQSEVDQHVSTSSVIVDEIKKPVAQIQDEVKLVESADSVEKYAARQTVNGDEAVDEFGLSQHLHAWPQQSDTFENTSDVDNELAGRNGLVELDEDQHTQRRLDVLETMTVDVPETQHTSGDYNENGLQVADDNREVDDKLDRRDDLDLDISTSSLRTDQQSENYETFDSQFSAEKEDDISSNTDLSPVRSSHHTDLLDHVIEQKQDSPPHTDQVMESIPSLPVSLPPNVLSSPQPDLPSTVLPDLPSMPPPDLPPSPPPDLPPSPPPDLPPSPPPDLPSSPPPDLPASSPPTTSHEFPESMQHADLHSVSPCLPISSAFVSDRAFQSGTLSPDLSRPVHSVDSALGSQPAERLSSTCADEPSSNTLALQPTPPLPELNQQEAGRFERSSADFDIGDQHEDSGISDEEAPPPLTESPQLEVNQESPAAMQQSSLPVCVSPQLLTTTETRAKMSVTFAAVESPPPMPESSPPAVIDSLHPIPPDTEPPALPVSLPPDDWELFAESKPDISLQDSSDILLDSQLKLSQENCQLSVQHDDIDGAQPNEVGSDAPEDVSRAYELLPAMTDGHSYATTSNVSPTAVKVDHKEELWKHVEYVLMSTLSVAEDIQKQTGLTAEISDEQERDLWYTVESVESTESNVGPLPSRSGHFVMADTFSDDDDDDDDVV